jgi:hypothetical protein
MATRRGLGRPAVKGVEHRHRHAHNNDALVTDCFRGWL